MMHSPDGHPLIQIDWDDFVYWQQWLDSEKDDNPPMTIDFAFWYREKKYYCTGEDYGFVIVDKDWNRIAYSKNFRKLLLEPVFDGKSFKDSLDQIYIED